MEDNLIYGGMTTLEDLCRLHDEEGFEFVIENGKVTEVIHD